MPFEIAGLIGDPLAFLIFDVLAAKDRLDICGHALSELTLGADRHMHPGETRCQPCILALTTNRQAQLMVGHDYIGSGAVLGDDHLVDLCRRERLGDEIAKIVTEGDDVDLLAPKFVDHHANAGAAGTHTGPDRIDVVIVRPDGDLGASTWLAGTGLDLDGAIGDLGDLEFEQPLDQAWVGTTHHDLGALGGFAYLDDIGLTTIAGLGALVLHLFGLGQQRLDSTEVEQRVAGIGLLDDAVDDVAFAVGVLLELAVAFDLTDALTHHLAEGLGGDTAELGPLRGVIAFIDPVAILVEVVSGEGELHRFGVDLDHDLIGGVRAALIGRCQRIDQHVQQVVL